MSMCTGLFDPDVSQTQLLATSERIVQLAPDFAAGWAGVAIGRSIYAENQQDRNGMPDAEALKAAHEAIARARDLDPHSGSPYVAEWHLVRDDPLRGMRLLERGIEVDPDEPLLYARLSNSLMGIGRMNDAVEAAHRAIELEPLFSFTRSSYINALTYAGQFARAQTEIASARRRWPRNSEIDQAEFDYQYRYGDPRAAEKLLPTVAVSSDTQLIPYRKMIAARLDPTQAKIDDAISAVAHSTAADPRKKSIYLLALAQFGRTEEIYRLLGDTRVRSSIEPGLLFRPQFASLRADPRFMSVAAQLGLLRYWRKSGKWPDFCTTEALRYDCRAEAIKYK